MMNQLPRSTIRLITSAQAISGVSSIVKELVENAIDAGATAIEVRLTSFGLEKIEVKDNGSGVTVLDVPYLARKHYTSKIVDFSSLVSLNTLGFRGEALGAMAAVSRLEVYTKCSDESVGRYYVYDNKGDILDETTHPQSVGTSVVVNKIYSNIPVRRQFYSAAKRKKDELKATTDLLMAYGVVYPQVRFTLKHDKNLIWQKSSVDTIGMSLSQVLTPSIYRHLKYYVMTIGKEKEVTIEIYSPELASLTNDSVYRSSNDRVFIFVNKRMVHDKSLEKILREYLCQNRPGKYPICCLSIAIPAADIDVNLEPNKTKVEFSQKDQIISELEEFFKETYSVHGLSENSISEQESVAESSMTSAPEFIYVSPQKHRPPNQQPSPSSGDVADDIRLQPRTRLELSSDSESDSDELKQHQNSLRVIPDLGQTNLGHTDVTQTDIHIGHTGIGCTDLGQIDIGHTDIGHADIEYTDIGHTDAGHIDIGYADVGHNDLLHSSSHVDSFKNKDQSEHVTVNVNDDETVLPDSTDLFKEWDGWSGDEEIPLLPVGEKENVAASTTESNRIDQSEHDTNSTRELYSVCQKESQDTENVLCSNTFICNTYNSQSICQASTPVKQSQLTDFYLSANKATQPSTKTNDASCEVIGADKWVRGQAIQHQFKKHRKILLFSHKLWSEENGFEVLNHTIDAHKLDVKQPIILAQPKNLAQRSLIDCGVKSCEEPISMIREETIPEEYRHIVQTSKARKRKLHDKKECPSSKVHLENQSGSKISPKTKRIRKMELKCCVMFDIDTLSQTFKNCLPVSRKRNENICQGITYCGSPRTTTGCVVKLGEKLFAFNIYRFKERELYDEYIAEYKVPSQALDSMLPIDRDSLGDSWDNLISLPLREGSSDFLIQCPSIDMNGFAVALSAGDYYVTSIPKGIPGYGIDDLPDVLKHARDATLYRPIKVLHHIQGEVVRAVREKETLRPRNMMELLQDHINIPDHTWIDAHCFHDRPILVEICDLSSLNLS